MRSVTLVFVLRALDMYQVMYCCFATLCIVCFWQYQAAQLSVRLLAHEWTCQHQ